MTLKCGNIFRGLDIPDGETSVTCTGNEPLSVAAETEGSNIFYATLPAATAAMCIRRDTTICVVYWSGNQRPSVGTETNDFFDVTVANTTVGIIFVLFRLSERKTIIRAGQFSSTFIRLQVPYPNSVSY